MAQQRLHNFQRLICFVFGLGLAWQLYGQQPAKPTSGEIYKAIERLNFWVMHFMLRHTLMMKIPD